MRVMFRYYFLNLNPFGGQTKNVNIWRLKYKTVAPCLKESDSSALLWSWFCDISISFSSFPFPRSRKLLQHGDGCMYKKGSAIRVQLSARVDTGPIIPASYCHRDRHVVAWWRPTTPLSLWGTQHQSQTQELQDGTDARCAWWSN